MVPTDRKRIATPCEARWGCTALCGGREPIRRQISRRSAAASLDPLALYQSKGRLLDRPRHCARRLPPAAAVNKSIRRLDDIHRASCFVPQGAECQIHSSRSGCSYVARSKRPVLSNDKMEKLVRTTRIDLRSSSPTITLAIRTRRPSKSWKPVFCWTSEHLVRTSCSTGDTGHHFRRPRTSGTKDPSHPIRGNYDLIVAVRGGPAGDASKAAVTLLRRGDDPERSAACTPHAVAVRGHSGSQPLDELGAIFRQ